MNKYKLTTYTPEAINGFWDGGKKRKFDWILGITQKDNKGEYQRVNGFEANYWFNVSKGKTDKQTLSYALKHLKANAKRNGQIISFWEIVPDNDVF